MRVLARALAWVLAALVLLVPLCSPGGLLGPSLALASSTLTVTGSVADLAPHAPATLSLTVHNDGSSDAVVTGLTARVTGVTGSCSPSDLSLTPWYGSVVVPAGGSVVRDLPVLLSADCGAATWDLSYTAVTG